MSETKLSIITRSKGSVNLPQGFVGLTLICKDFKGFSRNERNNIFLPKKNFTRLAKIKFTKLTKKINLPDFPKIYL